MNDAETTIFRKVYPTLYVLNMLRPKKRGHFLLRDSFPHRSVFLRIALYLSIYWLTTLSNDPVLLHTLVYSSSSGYP